MDPNHKLEILDKLIKCEDIENPDLHFTQLRELGSDLIQNPTFDDLIKFLNAVSNKKRLIIIISLREKDRCVCELETILDESQPSISHHLKILENAGLIKGWKKGKFTHYDIVNKQIISYLDLLYQKIV
ncbi:MAG: ArsR/SmtB family transcription factor [Promethearchaeota archaeon]|jgi:DNA-binding transcriptional ArsR family regulator